MFYEQLKKVCEQKGTTVTQTLKQIGLTSANMGRWKAGGAPSVEVLLKLSELLNISTDYLLKEVELPKENELSENEKEILEILNQFENKNDQAVFIYMARKLARDIKADTVGFTEKAQ